MRVMLGWMWKQVKKARNRPCRTLTMRKGLCPRCGIANLWYLHRKDRSSLAGDDENPKRNDAVLTARVAI